MWDPQHYEVSDVKFSVRLSAECSGKTFNDLWTVVQGLGGDLLRYCDRMRGVETLGQFFGVCTVVQGPGTGECGSW